MAEATSAIPHNKVNIMCIMRNSVELRKHLFISGNIAPPLPPRRQVMSGLSYPAKLMHPPEKILQTLQRYNFADKLNLNVRQ